MSAPNTSLRVDRIFLRNFRCFAECSLQLDPNLTVLVAENAQGKTAILSALRIALNVFVEGIAGAKQIRGFSRSDIHRVRIDGDGFGTAPVVEFLADGVIAGEGITWKRELSSRSSFARSTRKDIQPMLAMARSLALQLNETRDKPVVLPCVAFYGTGRLWSLHRSTRPERRRALATPARLSAYLDCLSPSSSFNTFSSWYGETALAVRDPSSRALSSTENPISLLAAVRRAVKIVLEPTGWTDIDWEFSNLDEAGHINGRGFLVVEHRDRGRLPIALLSDGIRNMVALVGDLAHRCARLNPHLGEEAAFRTPGIILVDEIDMHLHPSWQQLVIGLLRDAFPNVQMIFTTHSPQVLTTITRESIRIIQKLEDGTWQIHPPIRSVLAQESSEALAFVMSTDPRPKLSILDDIQKYEQFARSGLSDSVEAKTIWERLQGAGFEFSDAQKTLFAFLANKTSTREEWSHD